jgi:uncharacterized membrane protein YagU involved in acid resistance
MALIRRTLRTGTVAGIAMIPFGVVFRIFGLRINEYGRKTLTLVVGEVRPPGAIVLTLLQHLVISWIVAVPLLFLLERIAQRRTRVLVGMAYGAAFYAIVNSLALPFAFGDPMPWQLGLDAVYSSLTVHLVYGAVIALTADPRAPK